MNEWFEATQDYGSASGISGKRGPCADISNTDKVSNYDPISVSFIGRLPHESNFGRSNNGHIYVHWRLTWCCREKKRLLHLLDERKLTL